MSTKLYWGLLFTIVIVATILRTYHLSTNPPGFFADEAAIGYNAYTLLTRGSDEYHIKYPLFFKSFGEYRLPIPIYANMPSIALFGINEFAVRFTAAVFGIISIVFIAQSMTELAGRRAGLLTGLIATFLPWHLHMSRWGSEYIYFVGVFSIAVYFVFLSFRRQWLLIPAFVVGAISMYTYYPAWLTVPLFFSVVSAFWLVKFRNFKIFSLALLSAIILLLPLFNSFRTGEILARWRTLQTIERNISPSERFTQSAYWYMQHFEFDFLFLHADYRSFPRHGIMNQGTIYWFMLPLVLVGLFRIVRFEKDLRYWLIFWLFIIYPWGSAIQSGAFSTRSIVGIFPFLFLSVIGLESLLVWSSLAKKKSLLILFVIICVLQPGRYLYHYFVDYPHYQYGYLGWQWGAGEIVKEFVQQNRHYDGLYNFALFNQPVIFYKFYDPKGKCTKCFAAPPQKLNTLNDRYLFAFRIAQVESLPSLGLIFKPTRIIYYPLTNEPVYAIGTLSQIKR